MTGRPLQAPKVAESKIQAYHRLRREGRWEEAGVYRDTVKRNLRKDGVDKDEANDTSWALMIEKFPPLPKEEKPKEEKKAKKKEEPTEAIELIDVDKITAKESEPDLARDIIWAYENAANAKAKPEEAPSVGAWSLLKWARDNRNRFFEQLVPKAMATKAKEDNKDEGEDNVDPELSEVRRTMRLLRRSWHESLSRDLDGTIYKRVEEVVNDWCGKHGKAGKEAVEELCASMCGIVSAAIKKK